VFPEGEKGMGKLWKDRYRLQRFGRGGFVKLALRTGAPIIPVAVVGAEEAAPMLGKVTWFAKNIGIPWIPVTPTFPWLGPAGLLPLPSKWYVAFGPPIDLGRAHGPAAAEDRLLVNRLADQIRTQIQDMIEHLLGQRRSPVLPAFLG
jgi:1-acyl-sn-glycerol-3-phosphate acyltransferase